MHNADQAVLENVLARVKAELAALKERIARMPGCRL